MDESQQFLGACSKCRVPGPTPDLLAEKLHLNKTPSHVWHIEVWEAVLWVTAKATSSSELTYRRLSYLHTPAEMLWPLPSGRGGLTIIKGIAACLPTLTHPTPKAFSDHPNLKSSSTRLQRPLSGPFVRWLITCFVTVCLFFSWATV